MEVTCLLKLSQPGVNCQEHIVRLVRLVRLRVKRGLRMFQVGNDNFPHRVQFLVSCVATG